MRAQDGVICLHILRQRGRYLTLSISKGNTTSIEARSKNLPSSFTNIPGFHPLFFDPLLEQTQRFYQAESENLSGPNAFKERPGEFLVHCGKRISEETQRSKEVLGAFPWCENEIQKATEEALLRGRLQWLCGGAFSFVPLCLLFESI